MDKNILGKKNFFFRNDNVTYRCRALHLQNMRSYY